MLSSYRFSTLASEFTILAGNAAATELGCVSVNVTPDLGSSLKNALTFVPLAILVLVGIAVVSGAIFSPWGTSDPFRWTSNYGRDEDVLRLVTPGFGDCLQYIQFIVLTGGLSLNYPGFYQPAVSQGAWSTLMFNHSFLDPSHQRNPIEDGVYAIKHNGTYGLDRLEELVGVSSPRELWPGMMVWFLVVVAAVTVLIQTGFLIRRLERQIDNNPEEDLRAKNIPFTVGNVIRITCNFLVLPLVSISFFQLVIAGNSPAYSVAMAALVIVVLIGFALWVVRIIATTRPKAYLFDDLSTVLLYGPLYNTYCDDAAAFAVVPLFISFARAIAIGALQPSGIAQIVLLAICEVVNVLTLIAFRPFPEPTSMNVYHACFSVVRFLTILLSVTFVPSLAVSQAARGWIGYVILLLHGLVLVFGFFLNALQTLIEVVARLAGAGGSEGSVARGGLVKVLGKRQLSRREPRRSVGRQSMGSEAAMLAHTDDRVSSQFGGSRARSLSGSSALLLNRPAGSDGRASVFIDTASAHAGAHSRASSGVLLTPTTIAPSPGQGPDYEAIPGGPPQGIVVQPQDPYYRPPRPRGQTMNTVASSPRRGVSAGVGIPGEEDDRAPSGRATPVPAYIPAPKDELDYDDPRQSRKDYAVREVDFYYRVRGPPLSKSGTRKLKTGPADPTGPVSSATGWFRNLFQGKTKDRGKGFEVVRSARAPPPGLIPEEQNERYGDDSGQPHDAGAETPYHYSEGEDHEGFNDRPVLPEIDKHSEIELSSRTGSRDSAHGPPPTVPRKSSKRHSHAGSLDGAQSLAAVAETGPVNVQKEIQIHDSHSAQLRPSSGTGRFPFSATSSPSRDRGLSIASTTPSNSSHAAKGSQDGRGDRPSSMGYVSSHRASDHIHEAIPDEPSLAGSTAELVDDPGPSKVEPDHGHDEH